jgi:hypothetical protein
LRLPCSSKQQRATYSSLFSIAEEEGFELRQYEGGNRWYALVRYARNVENMGFAIFRVERAFERSLISSFFVANVTREG